MNLRPILMLAVLPCAACSTIFEGTDQRISVTTNPPGASCSVTRRGQEIAKIDNTPGTITVDRTKYDIIVKCEKAGFLQANYLNHSGTDNMAVMNGPIGWAVDSADGADNRYDSAVNVSMTPATIPGAALAPAGSHAGIAPAERPIDE